MLIAILTLTFLTILTVWRSCHNKEWHRGNGILIEYKTKYSKKTEEPLVRSNSFTATEDLSHISIGSGSNASNDRVENDDETSEKRKIDESAKETTNISPSVAPPMKLKKFTRKANKRTDEYSDRCPLTLDDELLDFSMQQDES